MLFSNPRIANLINSQFEPTWESVRPVPIINIDFGSGVKLTRTLNGNIATYVCSPTGQVLDIVPGIYDVDTYTARLEQLSYLANYVNQEGPAKLTQRLQAYHQGQLDAAAKNEPAPRLLNMANLGKAFVENKLKVVLLPGVKAEKADPAVSSTQETSKPKSPGFDFDVLKEDAKLNEAVRRQQIATLLAKNTYRPSQLTKKLYKEVLLADLDDPYLGLGKTLFTNYPWAEEDAIKQPTSNKVPAAPRQAGS